MTLSKAMTAAVAVICTAAASSAPGRAAGEPPAEELARRAFSEIAPAFVEMEQQVFRGRIGAGAVSGRFATRPRAAGWPGLCEADTVWVMHRTPAGDGLNPPLQTATVYKAAGDLENRPGMWTKAYEADLAARCAHAGRVLPTVSGRLDEPHFFGAASAAEAWRGARALQLALARIHADPKAAECLAAAADCRAELAAPQALTLDRLEGVQVAPCPVGQADCYLITGTFFRGSRGNETFSWVVDLEAVSPAPRGEAMDVARVGRIRLSLQSVIVD